MGRPATSTAVIVVVAVLAQGAVLATTSTGRYVVYVAVLVGSALALAGRLLAQRVPARDPWWVLTAGIACIAVQMAVVAGEKTGLAPATSARPVSGVFQLAGYLLIIWASEWFVRLRTGGRDRDGLIDASIVGSASAVVLWQWTAPQNLARPVAQVLVGAVPAVLLATVLALSVRLVFAASDVVAARLIVLATSASLVGNLLNLTPKLAGELSPAAVCCWIVSQSALVAAAFHPSRPRVTRRPDAEPALLTARLAVLGLALAGIPVSTVVLAGSRRVVPVVGTVVVTALVLWRLGRSLHERERRAGHQLLMLRLGRLAVDADRPALYAAAVEAAVRITGTVAAAGLELGGPVPGVMARAGAWPADLSAAEEQAMGEAAAAASAAQFLGPATVGLRDQVLTVVPFGPPGAPHGLVAVAGAVETDLGTLHGVAQILGSGVRRLRAEADLVHTSVHDALTGLPNRVLLYDRLTARASRGGVRPPEPFAVMFVDLDGFKIVNDSLGHAAGDRILQCVAERLRACVRPADLVARVSGDEFVVLLERADRVAAEKVAQRVTDALVAPVSVGAGAREATVSASIGVVVVPEPAAADVDQLLRRADELMYEVKRAGRNGYRIAVATDRPATEPAVDAVR
jgi:diguanylate cyclase (GGDEF)-like protein